MWDSNPSCTFFVCCASNGTVTERIDMSKREYTETVQKTEAIIGSVCLYAMVFIVTGLVYAVTQ